MRCEDKCASATMRCIDCGVCSAHAFFGPGSAGECMACTADRIRKEQEKRMSKSLTPPEVVQALMDEKTVQYRRHGVTNKLHVNDHGVLRHHNGACWNHEPDFPLTVVLLLDSSSDWSIVPDTYDWARARQSRGKVRSVVTGAVYEGLWLSSDVTGLRVLPSEVDGQWEDA